MQRVKKMTEFYERDVEIRIVKKMTQFYEGEVEMG